MTLLPRWLIERKALGLLLKVTEMALVQVGSLL